MAGLAQHSTTGPQHILCILCMARPLPTHQSQLATAFYGTLTNLNITLVTLIYFVCLLQLRILVRNPLNRSPNGVQIPTVLRHPLSRSCGEGCQSLRYKIDGGILPQLEVSLIRSMVLTRAHNRTHLTMHLQQHKWLADQVAQGGPYPMHRILSKTSIPSTMPTLLGTTSRQAPTHLGTKQNSTHLINSHERQSGVFVSDFYRFIFLIFLSFSLTPARHGLLFVK
jgi:hypothetical protein